MKKITLILLVWLFANDFGNAQSWDWAEQGFCNSASSFGDVLGIATDKSGNIYETGYLGGSITIGTYTLTTFGNDFEAYIVKYSSNGNVIWATSSQQTAINSYCQSGEVITDKLGNVYIAGVYQGNVIFGNDTLIGGDDNVFLVKYNSIGNVVWAKSSAVTGAGNYMSSGPLIIDSSGNIVITGDFYGNVRLGSFNLSTHGINNNLFVAKFDSMGNVLWVINPTLFPSGTASATALCQYSNYYVVTGDLADTAVFGDDTLIGNSSGGVPFLVKYDSNGNVVWATCGEVSQRSIYSSGYCVVTDKNGIIYVTGPFKDTLILASDTLKAPNNDFFLAKYSDNGSLIWAKSGNVAYSQNPIDGRSLTFDKWGYLYFSGTFEDSLKFDTVTLISHSGYTSFLFQLDTTGYALCGTYINNFNDDINPIVANPIDQTVYFGGDFYEMRTCSFGPFTLVSNYLSAEVPFIAKWQPCFYKTLSEEKLNNADVLSIYPNPSNGLYTIQIKGELAQINKNIEIYNTMGQEIYSQNNIQTPTLNINLSGRPNGVYLYRILDDTGNLIGNGKIVLDK